MRLRPSQSLDIDWELNGKKFTEMESPGHVREWGIGAEGDLAVDHKGNVFFVDT